MRGTSRVVSYSNSAAEPWRNVAAQTERQRDVKFGRLLMGPSYTRHDARITDGEQMIGRELPRDDSVRQQAREELQILVRAIQTGITDAWQLTDLIFYARHPQMVGVPLTGEHQELLDEWNAISALMVHPTLNEVGDFLGVKITSGEARGADEIQEAFARAGDPQIHADPLSGPSASRFDEVITQAVQLCPGLLPSILKGLLAQESNFNPHVINQYGYAGIAQFGREAAREVGLRVGIAGSAMDERLDPLKAIPAAARLLHLKAQRLSATAFSRYGQPQGIEFWKFVLAAYNGGEGTVSVAMGHAHRAGLEKARNAGLVGVDAVSFAHRYASQWENLKTGGLNSPLGIAATLFFPALAAAKYQEISNYPTAIMARAAQERG